MLGPRLFTRLARSVALFEARSEALYGTRSIGGSQRGLLSPGLSTGLARSEALYDDRLPQDSLQGLAGSKALYKVLRDSLSPA